MNCPNCSAAMSVMHGENYALCTNGKCKHEQQMPPQKCDSARAKKRSLKLGERPDEH